MLLEELIPNINIEDYEVEFKGIIEEGPNPSSPDERLEVGWLKEMAAFANTRGGRLFVGVNAKTHELLALDHETSDRITLMVQRLVKEHIEPPIRYTISALPVPDTKPTRYVIQIEVEKSKYPPISMHFGGLSVIYVRHFGKTSPATGEEIRDLIMNSESVSFDDRLTEEVYKPEDFSFLHQYYAERNEGSPLTDKALISIGFMSSARLLSKGALLFKDDCDDERTLISCTQFLGFSKGDDTYYYTDEYRGNLLKGYEHIMAFIRGRAANGFVKKGASRVPLISYPERSLTEGIVNALGHRNYFIQGSQIEINLYRDRLEIVSPGSLVGSRWLNREKDLSSIPPLRRNNVICGVFSLCRLMEEKGSGFDKIEAEYAPYGDGYAPYASSTSQYFSLTLPDLSREEGLAEQNDLPSIHTVLPLEGKHDRFILSFCYGEERSASDIASALHIKPSSYFRKEVLGRLVKDGYLIPHKVEKVTLYHSSPSKVLLGD